MDLRFGDRYETLRREARSFLASNWPLTGAEADLPDEERARAFRRRAIDAGYLYRLVPREYGGAGTGTDPIAETVIRQEFDAADAPRGLGDQGVMMLVPTLLECGTPAQCERYVPGTLLGEIRWCQGYSEPGAGSDLASLRARAELDGDEWVLQGHKIWTSNAQDADFMFGLFRTEPDAARHGGISYLLVDMRQPGIDVRPLRQMNGADEFCEVFLDGARTPADHIVGERGEGWKVSKATLKHERLLMGDFSYLARNFRALVWLAKQVVRNGRPAIEDPGVRQRLAEIEGYVLTNEYSSYRMVTAVSRDQDGKAMDAMLTAKLYVSEALRHVADLALDLLGNEALRAPDDDEVSMTFLNVTKGAWVSQYMFSMAMGIAGGASNIQRNIIGEKLLGLPRDVRSS